MGAENQSTVIQFILLGFPHLQGFDIFIFIVLLLAYVFINMGNMIIVLVIKVEPPLSKPMYFFVSNLSIIELWCTAAIIPKMLANILVEGNNISFSGCFLQAYFLHSLGAAECYMLTVMAYDRYLAITQPLHYPNIMTSPFSIRLAVGCWFIGFLSPVVETILISSMPFCGPNEIPFLFCDFPPLMTLACIDVSFYILVEFIVSACIIIGTSLVVLLSYVQIIRNILRIRTKEGRRKTFSTCASHLTVVIIFYGSIAFMYLKLSKSRSVNYDRVVALLFAVFTPLMNPIIYSLRNKEIKESIKKTFRQKILFANNLGFHPSSRKQCSKEVSTVKTH